MACPICVTPEGTAITAGIRAGAGVMIFVTAIVIGLIARFAYRLWAAEGTASDTRATEGTETAAPSTRAAEGTENTDIREQTVVVRS
jgi:hypothetical protein